MRRVWGPPRGLSDLRDTPRRAMLETTAAQARLDAPNLATAEKIDANAEKEHQAAVEAAHLAQVSNLLHVVVTVAFKRSDSWLNRNSPLSQQGKRQARQP